MVAEVLRQAEPHLTPDFERRVGGSPDRADALVWAIAELLGLERQSSA